MFFCAISGSPPTAPVVSKTSGTVYEKALIERYIEENGTDPISGEALTKDDLIDVKARPSTLPPRPANQTSIPALLTSLQSEYDAIMLESLEIKKAFQSSRQELANALYREDAATRVIARLLKERDEARQGLSDIRSSIGLAPQAPAEEAAEDVEMGSEGVLPASVKNIIQETHEALSSTRKKRKPAPGYADAEALKAYTQTSHVPSLHATKPPGITALDVAADGNLALTGGADKVVQLFDLAESKVVSTLKGHTKPITHVEFAEKAGQNTLAVSSSADKTVRVWGETDGEWSLKSNFKNHKGDVTGIAVHPSKSLLSAASSDSTWSLYDLAEGKEVHTYSAIAGDEGSFAYTSFGVHPDGILYGGGVKDGSVRVWDVRDPSSLAGTISSHSSPVTSLSFSENGYYLATASNTDPTVNIVDLRKLSILTSWKLPEENTVSEVKFDTSAQFLSVAGTDLRVYKNKTWEELLKFDDNAGVLTGARFVKNGSEIVTGGLDRTLRVLGRQA